jgi:hypothetical protein
LEGGGALSFAYEKPQYVVAEFLYETGSHDFLSKNACNFGDNIEQEVNRNMTEHYKLVMFGRKGVTHFARLMP